MGSGRDDPRPRGEGAARPGVSGAARAVNYGRGVLLRLLGAGLLAGFDSTRRAPAKLFNLRAAGGVRALLPGVGLFLRPLEEDRLHAFRHEPDPIAVFRVKPASRRVRTPVISAAMAGAFVCVSQNMVRIGR